MFGGMFNPMGGALKAAAGNKMVNPMGIGQGQQQMKPQLGGGLGPSIKQQSMNPQMQQKQMGPPSSAPQTNMPQQGGGFMQQMPPWMRGQGQMGTPYGQNQGGSQQSPPIQPPQNRGMQPPPWAMSGRGMGPSPMGMPPWMRNSFGGGGMMQPHVMPQQPRNTGFMPPMQRPNI